MTLLYGELMRPLFCAFWSASQDREFAREQSATASNWDASCDGYRSMCIDRCVDRCIDMCADMRIDMCVDMCIDMCTDMCIAMFIYVCIDLV